MMRTLLILAMVISAAYLTFVAVWLARTFMRYRR